jgi:hypothetical protein
MEHNSLDIAEIKRLKEKVTDLQHKIADPLFVCSWFHERTKLFRNIRSDARVSAFRCSYRFPDKYELDRTPQIRSFGIRFTSADPLKEASSRAGRMGGRPRTQNPTPNALRVRRYREKNRVTIA